ncbi:MAG: hypothetical protein H6R14_2785 [Proteobacteria bacterium]|nr:hypothetical protein [Pseudomonadota bacterium]
MSLFSFDPSRTLTNISTGGLVEPPARARGPVRRGGGTPDFLSGLFSRDDGSAATRDDLADQFIVYQISKEAEGPALLDASAVKPGLEGTPEQPDVLARLNMTSFHVGTGEDIDPDTRATMRITFGADASSSGRIMDTAFWAVAAGMKLYQNGGVTQDKQLAADLNRAFANRPVEIAGGLGLLSFEVVRHEEPAWWKQLFAFAQGPTGQTLTSVLGFPAITQPALALVDELLGRLAEDKHEVLFKSAPMRLALTQQAHDEFTGGNPRIKLGGLSDGYCVLARGRDRDALVAADPVFYPTHGILAPATANPARIQELTTDNPLHTLTYAVFRIKTKSTMLDPDFAFRG